MKFSIQDFATVVMLFCGSLPHKVHGQHSSTCQGSAHENLYDDNTYLVSSVRNYLSERLTNQTFGPSISGEFCGVQPKEQSGFWFRVDLPVAADPAEASTPIRLEAGVTSVYHHHRLSILTGDDCEDLTCVTYYEETTNDTSSIEFDAYFGNTYFLLYTGETTEEPLGSNQQLQLELASGMDSCRYRANHLETVRAYFGRKCTCDLEENEDGLDRVRLICEDDCESCFSDTNDETNPGNATACVFDKEETTYYAKYASKDIQGSCYTYGPSMGEPYAGHSICFAGQWTDCQLSLDGQKCQSCNQPWYYSKVCTQFSSAGRFRTYSQRELQADCSNVVDPLGVPQPNVLEQCNRTGFEGSMFAPWAIVHDAKTFDGTPWVGRCSTPSPTIVGSSVPTMLPTVSPTASPTAAPSKLRTSLPDSTGVSDAEEPTATPTLSSKTTETSSATGRFLVACSLHLVVFVLTAGLV